MAAAATRLPGLDGLKGLAIALVVLIHAAPPAAKAPFWNEWIVEGVARLAVPTFLLVSGFLHARRGTPSSRLLAHAWTFLRLHLAWASIHALADLLDPSVPFSWDLRSLLLHFGAGAWAGQFFLVALVQILLVAGWLGHPRRWASAPAVIAFAAAWGGGLALLMAWNAGAELPAPLEWVARARSAPGWFWLVYFAMGAWASRLVLPRVFRRRWVLAAAVLSAAALAGVALPPTAEESWAASFPYMRLSILLASAILAVLLPALATLPSPAWLCALGRQSFALYVLNPLILRVLFIPGGRAEDPLTSLGHALLTLLVGCALAEWLARRFPRLLP